jgi:anti-sigma factor RsiW
MMNCLSDAELQAVVDNEADAVRRAHLSDCPRCRARAEARREQMAAIVALADDRVPPGFEARLREAVETGGPARGSTALRPSPARGWRPAVPVASALAAAAVIGLIVFAGLPRFGSPATLSASEILGRSLQTLTGVRGVEQLEYELVFTGYSGAHRIEQLLDHDHANRFRIADFGPDGVMQSATSEDSVAGRRSHLVRVDGRNYIIELAAVKAPPFSLPQLAQAQVETVISMMQATSDQKLTTIETPTGKQYVIQIPTITSSSAAMLDLYQARVVIDANDFGIRELEASGAMFKQPYDVSFKLIRRAVRPSANVAASEFAIPAGPGDVVIKGEATNDPISDVLGTVLRELGRLKGN